MIWTVGEKEGVVAYSYVPDSNLLESVTSGGLETKYSYEAKRNLKTEVRNSWNSASTNILSQYNYDYDAIGRRENVENSGNAFTQTRHNIYTYNDRNEVTGSVRKEGTVENPVTTVDSEGRLYEYDPIGNRTRATEGNATPQLTTYTTDVTNRYTALSGGVSASPAYDDDGNMTAYNGAAYTWNAENRLVSVEKADKKITFLYDYMGRRVQKKVFGGTPGDWNTVPDETRVFVYDGWNLIKETVTGDTNGTYYVWGLDLSQSMQGAGGIGGLVCSVSGTAVRHYTYDANGNVGQLVDEAGTITARYEYDPFGNEIRAEGDDAQNNPFRFSTKYLDAETGLYYYGFRYYSAEIGRWISRDPLGEEGGYNLYSFVLNNPIYYLDPFGLNLIEDAIKWLGDKIDWIFNGTANGLGWKTPELAAGIRDFAQWQAKVGGLYNLEGTYNSAVLVLTVSALVGQAASGYGLVAEGGIISTTGGLILLGDTSDKVNELFTGENQFRNWVNSMPISEKEKTFILCAKEVSILVMDAAGAATLQKDYNLVKIGEKDGCFVAGTPVQTKEGLRPVEDIKPGDIILARDTETGEFSWREVVRNFSFNDRQIIELKFESENGKKEKIDATIEHPFWVKDRGWVGARELLPGDEVFTSKGGWLKVTGSTWLSGRQTVYNFEVDGLHNYFVGELGAWVHNASYVVTPKSGLSGLVDSNTIRFTQDTAGKNINGIASFKDGRPIQGLIDKFKASGTWPDDIPPLRVFEKDGLIYTLDNRRLVAAHQAGIQVKVTPATAEEIAKESFKFTNPKDGMFIGIKGELK